MGEVGAHTVAASSITLAVVALLGLRPSRVPLRGSGVEQA